MRKKQRAILSILVVMIMLPGIFMPGVAKALTFSDTVLDRYVGAVNGEYRELVLITDGSEVAIVLIVGEEEDVNSLGDKAIKVGFDQYGAIWILDKKNRISFRSYEITPGLYLIYFEKYDNNVESLIYEGSGRSAIVVGYKTQSGEIKSLPTFNEMKNIMKADSSIPEPHYIPSSETPAQELPDSSTLNPSEKPTGTPSQKPTAKPDQTPAPQQATTLAKVTGVKVKNNKKNKTMVSWKKVKDASGYELQYATSKNFKNSKIKGTKKTTVTIKKLKKKKTYYFRVRAYRPIKGKEVYYGKWSSAKKVKIKK